MNKTIIAASVALALAACGGGGDNSPVASNGGAGGTVPSGSVSTQSPAPSQVTGQSSGEAPAPAPASGASATLAAQNVSMVNTTTAGDQIFANQLFGALGSIGALPDGGYTVAWVSNATTFLQRYDGAGVKVGGEISFPALNVTMAVLSNGGLVAAHVLDNVDQQRSSIIVSRFDANGTLAGQTEVGAMSTPSSGPSLGSDVRVAALPNGGFVVGWAVFPIIGVAENQVFTQRFDSQGAPAGSLVQIMGTLPDGSFSSADGGGLLKITPDTQGGYTVSVGQPGVSTLSLVHFDANGTAMPIAIPSGSRALLLALEGRFVLFTSSSSGTSLQFLDSSGSPVGNPAPLVSMPFDARELADRSFVVFFNAGGTVTAQRFDSTGTATGNVLTLATGGAVPGITPLAGGGFALAWSAPGAAGDLDVFTQRFIPLNPA